MESSRRSLAAAAEPRQHENVVGPWVCQVVAGTSLAASEQKEGLATRRRAERPMEKRGSGDKPVANFLRIYIALFDVLFNIPLQNKLLFRSDYIKLVVVVVVVVVVVSTFSLVSHCFSRISTRFHW